MCDKPRRLSLFQCFSNKVKSNIPMMKLNIHKIEVLTFTVASCITHITGTLIAQHGSTTGSPMLTGIVMVTGNLI